ncbi:MAG: sigma-70 family RNA polymerase sigma factor [Polyangia bacterium]|jgi:RNA polymerase sigma-70 factor (ECF subfamily)
MEDSFLISQTLAGQQDSFRLLVLRHQRCVFRFLGVLGFGGQAAEDLAQEAFLRAYRHLSDFDPSRAKFSTWLFTMVRNLAANEATRAHRQRECQALEAAPVLADPAPDPLERAVANQAQRRLREALAQLPEVLRVALLLTRVEGLSLEEAAAVESCAVGTVKSRIFRARELLRAVLAEES